jgi:enoyl-CoA hydratase/carnithine racemase
LNRPTAANSINAALTYLLHQELAAAATSPGVAALVLTGAGKRAFCGGMDLRGAEPELLRICLTAILEFPKPLIIALNGAAVGGGAMLPLIADRVIATEGAVLRFPEVDLGIASFTSVALISFFYGEALARDLVQSGRSVSSIEARERGLISECVPEVRIQAAAQDAAEKLGAKPPLPFQAVKAWQHSRVKDALKAADAAKERFKSGTSG